MSENMAKATVLIDNARLRVTEWRFNPQAATGFHKHELDYMVVPMTTGKLLIKTSDGDSHAQLTEGQPYYREAGAEHDVINDNNYEFVFIETELK